MLIMINTLVAREAVITSEMQAGHNEADAGNIMGNMTKKIRGAIGHRRHIDGAIKARRDKTTQ